NQVCSRKRQNVNITSERIIINNRIKRNDLGRMNQTCIHCDAKFWMEEKNQNSSFAYPTFLTCCAHGKVRLPRLVELPPYLLNLYTSSNSDAISF
ncbi:9883_t:CDS:1, partial [Funneliformis mosseae]